MRIYLATWLLENSQGVTLTKCKSRNRLISYWHTKDVPSKAVREYLIKGKNEK